MGPERVSFGEEEEVHSTQRARTRKRRWNQQCKVYGTRNLEAESIRSRAEMRIACPRKHIGKGSVAECLVGLLCLNCL